MKSGKASSVVGTENMQNLTQDIGSSKDLNTDISQLV